MLFAEHGFFWYKTVLLKKTPAFSLPAFCDPAHQDKSERAQFNPLIGRNEMAGGFQE